MTAETTPDEILLEFRRLSRLLGSIDPALVRKSPEIQLMIEQLTVALELAKAGPMSAGVFESFMKFLRAARHALVTISAEKEREKSC